MFNHIIFSPPQIGATAVLRWSSRYAFSTEFIRIIESFHEEPSQPFDVQ